MMALPRSSRLHAVQSPHAVFSSSFPFPFRLVAAKPAHKLSRCSLKPPPPPSSNSSPIEPRSPLNKAQKRWRRMSSQFHGLDDGADSLLVPDGMETLEKTSGSPVAMWKRIFFASKKVRSIILLNIVTLVHASSIPVVKEVQVIMDPALFTMVRFALAALPFLPFMLKTGRDWQTRVAGVELGLWVSLGYLAQALGLLTSDAGRASFISSFTMIVVPFIDGMFGSKVTQLTWFGAILSLLGVGMLECSGSPPSVGDALNLLSAICFGIHMLRTEHILHTTKQEEFFSLLGYEVSVVAFLAAVWFFHKRIFRNAHQLSSGSWASKLLWNWNWNWIVSFPWIPALYTGILSTGLCLWAELFAMRDVSATETAIIYGLEPVWGAAFAWFFLGERWGTIGWIGAALIICGSLTVQILGSKPERWGNTVVVNSAESSTDTQKK